MGFDVFLKYVLYARQTSGSSARKDDESGWRERTESALALTRRPLPPNIIRGSPNVDCRCVFCFA